MVRSLIRTLYVALWSAWFRWGRIPLSRLVDLWRPKGSLSAPRFASLEAFARWWQANTRWASDPFFGAFDIFASLEHALWCFEEKGIFEEDCDGLAYVAMHMVQRVPGVSESYLVTLAFDPFDPLPVSTLTSRLQNLAHVICVYRQASRWGVISNTDVFLPQWESFAAAVTRNPHCRGRNILWYEVRDTNLCRVAARRISAPTQISVA